MRKLSNYFSGIVGIFLSSSLALSYPEFIRHGYMNCTSCHVSPTGGGALTEYGRSLSDEVLSRWSRPGESGFLYGLLPTTAHFQGGGDIRGLRLTQRTPKKTTQRTIFMQGDVEAAARIGNWAALVSAGVEESGKESLSPLSRKHWVGYQVNENILIRAGKFQRAFLFNTAEHATLIKRTAGLDVGSETYNVEGSYLSETGEFFLTANLGRIDKTALDVQSGTTLKGGFSVGSKSKVGLQYDYERNSQKTQHLFGPYFALGLSEDSVVLSEIILNRGAETGKEVSNGLTSYTRFSYEAFKGGWLYAIHEWSQPSLKIASSSQVGSLGIQFFPRPHFEFNLLVQRQWLPANAGQNDLAFLLGHFYL